MRTHVKRVETALTSKDAEAARNELLEAIRVISKASLRGIIHKNAASRKISRLTKRVDGIFRSEAA